MRFGHEATLVIISLTTLSKRGTRQRNLTDYSHNQIINNIILIK